MKKSKCLYHKEMHEHYKELYKTAIKELKFARTQIEFYKNIIDEIYELNKLNVKQSLINWVIDNAKIRWDLDINIHYNLL